MDTTEEIQVEGAPAIPGLRFRHFGSERDFALMADLVNAAMSADGVQHSETAENLANFLNNLGNEFDPARDILFAEIDGEGAAYSRVRWWQEVSGTRLYSLMGYIHPRWRRIGLGRAMLRANERRARAIAAAHPVEIPKALSSYCDDKEQGTVALLSQEGYYPVRHFYLMVRPDLDNIPDLPLPDGVEARPTQPEEVRNVWDAYQAAFVDHWGYCPPTEEMFQQYLGSNEFQPELWQVAWYGDQVVGTVLSYIDRDLNQKFGFLRGWTEEITVQREWRGQGIAKALIARSLRDLKARGMQEAALGVDVENPSGALKLYEKMGYRAISRETSYRKNFA